MGTRNMSNNSGHSYTEGAEVPEDKTDNELIAQFMGLQHGHNADKNGFLKYNTSWDWLMPVVEKIETLYDTGIFYDGHRQPDVHNVRIYAKRGGSETIVIFYGKSKIETTYNAVVEFIKWHNLESLKNKPI